MNNTIASYFSQFDFYQVLVELLGSASLVNFIIFLVTTLIIVGAMATVGGLGTYAERKISADIQIRQGPNRVGPYGILQFLADGVKMVLKEDVIPREADKFLFTLAPLLCLTGVFATLAIVPFSSGFTLTDLNVGIIYIIGVASLCGVGIFLGGYASNSKWSMLGGMRGAAQIVSYEVPVTLSIMLAVVMAGGLSLGTFTEVQGGLPHQWAIFHNPFAFIAFFVLFVGGLAEANRAPFDLPEAESELVSGYHTEYTGMRFAFFALAEYIEVFVIMGTAVALFLGGYKVPFDLGNGELIASLGLHPLLAKNIGNFLQVGSFVTKTLLLYYVVIWIRWTLPRLRVDHVMTLCWKYLTPIALFNLIGVVVWMWAFDGQSIFEIIVNSGASAAAGH